MSTTTFFGLSCLVFLVVGPLVPIPVIAIFAAISTGDLGKLNGMFMLSGMSYLLGGPIALKFGAVFALCSSLLARFFPRMVPMKTGLHMALFGAALGLAIGCAFILPGFLSSMSRIRFNPPFKDDLALSLLVWWRSDASTSFTFFVLPSVLCGGLAAAWLLPKLGTTLRPNDLPAEAAAFKG